MFSNNGIISETCTFILAGGPGKRLDPLTRHRAKPLVPFGGIFRIIDFTLSNCLNSALRRVFLLTQHRHASISDYIERASGPGGLFSASQDALLQCLPSRHGGYQGTADAVFQNIPTLKAERPEFVLILAADHVYKMDYAKLLRWHIDSAADITLAATSYPRAMASRFGVLQVNSRDEVTAFEEKPRYPKSLPADPRMALVGMGIYVFNTSVLIKLLIEDHFRVRSSHDFGRDLIPASIASHRVCAYNVNSPGDEITRYWRDVGTIDAYYRSHMELLLMDSPFDPYNDALWPMYAFGNPTGQTSSLFELSRDLAVDSVVSHRSIISGAHLVQSVVAPAVSVGQSAEIQSSVLLPGVRIGRRARIRHAVIAENTRIPDGTEIGYDPEADRRRFQVTEGGVVVVTANGPLKSFPEREHVARIG